MWMRVCVCKWLNYTNVYVCIVTQVLYVVRLMERLNAEHTILNRKQQKPFVIFVPNEWEAKLSNAASFLFLAPASC